MSYRNWLVVGWVGLVLALVLAPAQAQTRSLVWNRWDVRIDNIDTRSNRFDVTEMYDVSFSGTFRFGSAVIPPNNLESIRNVRVSQDGQPLTGQGSCTQQPGTFCVENTSDGTAITYYFFQPITDGRTTFDLSYTVDGALRVYEGGDQLWWTAIPEEHYGFPILSSRVIVELPEGFAPREGVDPVETYGVPASVEVSGTRVVAVATQRLDGNDSLEIRVQYPHDPGARVADWQAAFDQRRDYEENVRPLVNLGALVVALLISLIAPLYTVVAYQRTGRDPQVGPVPEYLSEPPSDLPPAVVGALLDESADLRDVMSTLLDLARRGYLVIEETQEAGLFGIGQTRRFVFKRTDKSLEGLRTFEQQMMRGIFAGQMERSLDSLRERFYTTVAQMQRSLYKELVSEKLFRVSPETTRTTWMAAGGVLIAIGAVGLFLLVGLATDLGEALLCLPVALMLSGFVLLVAARAMPSKTRHGAEEAAKWNAFQEYLRNLEKYGDVGSAAPHFENYLPYAVAFGLDRTWLRRFRGVEHVPVPTWYFPTYAGGRWGRGYTAGTPIGDGMPAFPGELASGGGGFSLDDMSGGLSGGLENLSTGLTTMLETATRTMNSRPQSSGSGGGWSGGGFSGGGSSGGGSRGFG